MKIDKKLSPKNVQKFWDSRIREFGYLGVLWERQPSWNKYIDGLQMHYLKKYLTEINSKDKVLDVGCGAGRFTFRFAQEAEEVVGIDTSNEGILFCQKEAKKNKINNVAFVVADASSLFFKNNLFDKIFSITCLQHITTRKEFMNAVKELMRVLKKGGKIILLECATDKRKDKYVNSFPKEFWFETFRKYGGQVDFYSGVDINFLRSFGFSLLAHFRNQKINDFLCFLFTVILCPLEYSIPKIFKNLGWYYLIEIKK